MQIAAIPRRRRRIAHMRIGGAGSAAGEGLIRPFGLAGA